VPSVRHVIVPHTRLAHRWFAHAAPPTGAPGIQRWNDAIAAAVELQAEYASWLEALPDNQQDGALAEALRAIVELDLSEIQAIDPPRGFGRD
jgi:hypothetical protein